MTLFLTPYEVAVAPSVGRWVERRLRPRSAGVPRDAEGGRRTSLEGHVVVIGFGPAGQRLADVLSAWGLPLLIIDLQPRNVALARQQGLPAQLGDAAQVEVLRHAQVETAHAVVCTVPDHRSALQVLYAAKSLAPHVPVVVRARYHEFTQEFTLAGAQVVVDEEETVGKRLAVAVRRAFLEAGLPWARRAGSLAEQKRG